MRGSLKTHRLPGRRASRASTPPSCSGRPCRARGSRSTSAIARTTPSAGASCSPTGRWRASARPTRPRTRRSRPASTIGTTSTSITAARPSRPAATASAASAASACSNILQERARRARRPPELPARGRGRRALRRRRPRRRGRWRQQQDAHAPRGRLRARHRRAPVPLHLARHDAGLPGLHLRVRGDRSTAGSRSTPTSSAATSRP